MKTRIAALALALAGVACTADNNASVQIQTICSPTDDCTFESTCGMQYIGVVTLDLAVTNQLWLFLQVNNNMPDNADPERGKLNTNNAHVEEYLVEYSGAAAGGTAGRLQTTVPAAGSAVVSVFPIGAGTVAATGMVVAKLRLKGKLDDQSSFETADYEIPVLVCLGCTGAPTCSDGSTPTSVCPPNLGQLPLSAVCESTAAPAP